MALAPLAASAQVSVEVTPLRVELRTGAGATPYTQTVHVTNHGKDAVRIHARVDDWYLSKDGTPQFKLAEGDTAFSAASWVRVNPADQTVAPGADSLVRFSVTTPAGTEPGGYRAAIMFDLLPPGAEAAGRARNVMFQGRIATLVYVTVGVTKPTVELVDVQPGVREGQPPSVVATLKNTGRVHVRTKGTMVVYDKTGAVVRRSSLPDVPVLPESERDLLVLLTEEGKTPLPAGEYRVELRIDVGLPEVLVGETMVTIGR